MQRFFLLSSLLLLGIQGQAQDRFDTLRVMSYNLLFYGEQTSFCTNSNNNINDKDGYLKMVTDYLKPDLLLVNEMGASVVYADRIINNVLNTDGVDRFRRAGIQNNSFSSIVNGIFYDKNKLAQMKHDKVTKTLVNTDIVRAVDVITFYYKDPNLEAGADTTFLHLVGMHLKAGSDPSDEDQRDLATEAVMDELSTHYAPGYFIAAGDFNLKTSSEGAYQNLITSSNGDYRFFDPIAEPGNWSNNSNFSAIHTQSTHTSGQCFSGGGLDDRFDFILLSGQIMEDTGAVRYIEGSYRTVGNDGNHFNQSLLQGTNTSVPSTVRSALYEMSDHLPVFARLKMRLLPEPVDTDTIPTTIAVPMASGAWTIDQAPDFIRFRSLPVGRTLVISDLQGRVVMEKTVSSATWILPFGVLPVGVYQARIKDGYPRAKKLVLPR